MKKNTAIALIVSLVLVCMISIGVFAVSQMEKPGAVLSYIVGLSEEAPDYADANGDGKINVLDVILFIKEGTMAVVLNNITFDNPEYSVNFIKSRYEYTVEIPSGRAVVPLVSASAGKGLEVKISQGYIPDGKREGCAIIAVSNGSGDSVTYKVKFIRNPELGFVMQYDDRYTFTPDYILGKGESFVFESSDSNVISVDGNGVMKAAELSESAVTVFAKVGDKTVDTFTVNKVEKARINLFFITGQSNAQGCYDTAKYGNGDPNIIPYEEQLAAVERIGGEGRVYSYDVFPRSENTEVYALKGKMYDMGKYIKQGPQASLGKYWYDTTGEKVVFLQSAFSGAAIEPWLDPDRHTESGSMASSGNKYNFYDKTQEGYEALLSIMEDNYEIVRSANFWCQGDTGMSRIYSYETSGWIGSSDAGYDPANLISDETYYKYYTMIHNDMKEDFGIAYDGIMMVRTTHGNSSAANRESGIQTDIVPVVSAHFALANRNSDIYISVRRLLEIARMYGKPDSVSEGYGYISTDNAHYNQVGHNYNGREAAENAFAALFGCATTEIEAVELIDNNGLDRLTSNDVIEIKAGTTYRFGALPVPIYSDETLEWSTSDKRIAAVSEYGAVTGLNPGECTVTVTAESGKKQSVNVRVYENIVENVTYRWDFNDLTEKNHGNDLTLNPACPAEAASNYTLTGGKYATVSGVGDLARPDFVMKTPITLDSTRDWSIQWKGKIPDSGNTILGQNPVNTTGNTDVNGHIYISPYANWGTADAPKYVVKFQPESGSRILLPFTEALRYMTSSENTWKINYVASTNTMTLAYSTDDGATWTQTCSVKAGTFSSTYENVFGRTQQSGNHNFKGVMDYIEVVCNRDVKVTAKDNLEVTYRWDFDDLKESFNGNDLILNPLCHENAANNYSLDDGMYYVSTSVNELERPDFVMKTPFNLNSNEDWAVQWKGAFTGAGTLMGSNATDVTSTADTPGHFYTPPYTNWGGNRVIKFKTTQSTQTLLAYTDYLSYMTRVNTWRMEYSAETNSITLSFSTDDGGSWTTASVTKIGNFSVDFTNIFGRTVHNGKYNFVGSMHYIQVSLSK